MRRTGEFTGPPGISESLDALQRVSTAIAGELDLEDLLQLVTDLGREVSGAQYGAFFYNAVDGESGESFLLYTLSGAHRDDFARYPNPRKTEIFGPTFRGEPTVRSDDITKDPRYGRNAPFHGMPDGHLPVRSYLATPVVARSGEVIGGLFFGHERPAVFTELNERLITAIASLAAVGVENARLYESLETELASREHAEQRLTTAYTVSQVLARSASLAEAAPGILAALCAQFDADIAEIWLGEDRLRCAAFHSRLSARAVRTFRKAAESLLLGPGEGMPGAAWERKQPIWLEDIAATPDFGRRGPAAALGLHAGVAMPILTGTHALGAISCFMRKPVTADQSLRNMMASTGYKVGQFIERTRGEETNRFLGTVVETSSDAIVSTRSDGVITTWNAGATRLFGYTCDEAIGANIAMLVPPDRRQERVQRIERLGRGELIEPFESVRLHRTGATVPVSISFSGLYDSDGKLVGAAGIARDISKGKAVEAQLNARIRQLEVVSEIGVLALAGGDLTVLFEEAMARARAALDVDFAKVLELLPGGNELLLRAGAGWRKGLVGRATVGASLDSQAGYTLTVDGPVIVEDLRTETRFSGSPLLHDQGIIAGLSVVIRGRGDRPFGVLGVHTKSHRCFTAEDLNFVQSVANILADAIQKKDYELRQSNLVGELSHRVKNTLAVIQAIARQAGRQASSVEGFIESFEGRLLALGNAHDALTASNWSGASLLELAEMVVVSQAPAARVGIDLENLTLLPVGTQALALLLHELTTNAMKYGALSGDGGRIMLEGRVQKQGRQIVYRMSWKEEGGPPAVKPTRFGFGSRIVTATVEQQCNGKLKVHWLPEGLHVVCKLPVSAIAVTGARAADRPEAGGNGAAAAAE